MVQSNYTGSAKLGITLLWIVVVLWALEVVATWFLAALNITQPTVSGLVGGVLGFLFWLYSTIKVADNRPWARIVYLLGTIARVMFFCVLMAFIAQAGIAVPFVRTVILVEAFVVTLQVIGLMLVCSATSSTGVIATVAAGVAVLAAGTSWLLVPKIVTELTSDPKSASALIITALKLQHTQQLPKMIDDDTQFFDVRANEGMLVYHYRLVKVNATGFDAQSFLDRVKPTVIGQLCDQDDKSLLKQGILLRARYVDKSDADIGTVDVNSVDCEGGAVDALTPREAKKKSKALPETQVDTQPESPWGASKPTSTTTATKRPQPIAETPEAKAQALVDDGNLQMQRGNYDAAIKDFKAALELEPSNYAARSGLQEAQHLR